MSGQHRARPGQHGTVGAITAAAAMPVSTPTGTDAAIVMDSLTVVRGSTTVLADLNLTLRSGVITGLLGPSGCGKTTLMRAIVGAQVIKSGTVTVLGRPAGEKSLRGRVGYATQAASIYTDITVLENLRYFAKLYKVKRATVDTVLEQVDLTSRRNNLARDLSGGQRGRLSLACALIGDPDVLVLDEPTVGLDPVLRLQIWEIFGKLKDSGKTIVVSSHVMDEAERCEELVLMRGGRVLAHDQPKELLRQTERETLENAFLSLIDASGTAE